MYAHMIISLNRTWALILPLHYRDRHSKKVALMGCISMWILVHAALLPRFIYDVVHRDFSSSNEKCEFSDRRKNWLIALQFALYVLPELVILMAFPVIAYKRRRRKVADHIRAFRISDSTTSNPLRQLIQQAPLEGNGQAFVALALLTLSILICWTPKNVFVTITQFRAIENSEAVYEIMDLISAVQLITDPVMFIMAFPDLRTAVKAALLFQRSH